jgi:hypothetical protein
MLRKTVLSKLLPLSIFISLIVLGCQKENCDKPGKGDVASENKNTARTQLPYDSTHIISAERATYLIENFKNNFPSLRSTSYMTKESVNKILNQPDVARVRYYFGNTIFGQPELFFLGVNTNGDDIIQGKIISSTFTTTGISNLLNSLNLNNNQLVNLTAAVAATTIHKTNYSEVSFGGSFTEDAVRALIVDDASFGVRADIGLTEDNKWTVILRAVSQDGSIIINGVIIDKAQMCPPHCGVSNALNS